MSQQGGLWLKVVPELHEGAACAVGFPVKMHPGGDLQAPGGLTGPFEGTWDQTCRSTERQGLGRFEGKRNQTCQSTEREVPGSMQKLEQRAHAEQLWLTGLSSPVDGVAEAASASSYGLAKQGSLEREVVMVAAGLTLNQFYGEVVSLL